MADIYLIKYSVKGIKAIDQLVSLSFYKKIIPKNADTQGAMFRVCQLYFSTQTAMTAHIALTPLKSAAVRHGINAIVADIYNVAAAYDNSLADTQKILLRQSR